MCTVSSVEMLRAVCGGNGQPRMPATLASKVVTPARRPATTLARPMPRVLCRCRPNATRSPQRSSTRPIVRSIWAGLAMPVVSASISSEKPMSRKRPISAKSRDSGMSPSYGQPNAVPIAPMHATPRASTSRLTSANCARLASTLMRTFFWLNASLAVTTPGTPSHAAHHLGGVGHLGHRAWIDERGGFDPPQAGLGQRFDQLDLVRGVDERAQALDPVAGANFSDGDHRLTARLF